MGSTLTPTIRHLVVSAYTVPTDIPVHGTLQPPTCRGQAWGWRSNTLMPCATPCEGGARNVGRPKVLLWPDTFNNHFLPAVGQAAVEVLEAAGYQVDIPAQSLYCGHPL